MNEARAYEDGYRAVFQRQDDFLECIRKRMGNSRWDRRKAKTLRLAALTNDGSLTEQLREKYAEEGLDEAILTDTISNTGLVLKVKGEYYPVRDCAIKSILDRAGISGSGLRRVEKNVYARILNECLKVANGEALLRISEGKVSAVLGGDGSDYAVIDTEQLFMHTIDYLKGNFKGVNYLAGFYEHDRVSAIWEMTGEPALLQAYKTELMLAGKTPEEMTPIVRVTTSDTGAGGANIYPMLLCGKENMTINLGNPLRLGHRNGTSIAEYDKQLKMLYGKYQLAVGNLVKLLHINIQNPVNCMKGVMDKLGIARKYSADAVDLFIAQNGEDPCTAHDIYYGISEVLFRLASDGEEGSVITGMEEKIARALSVSWKDYDVPGVYKW